MFYENAAPAATPNLADRHLNALRAAIRQVFATDADLRGYHDAAKTNRLDAVAQHLPRPAWLKTLLADLDASDPNAPAEASPVWAQRFNHFAANLAAALKDPRRPDYLFAEPAETVATAAHELLAFPAEQTNFLKNAMDLVFGKLGAETRVLDALDDQRGSLVAAWWAPKASAILCLQSQRSEAFQQPSSAPFNGGRHLDLAADWDQIPADEAPFDLVCLAGGFNGECDRSRLSAVAHRIKAGSYIILAAPTDQHPLCQLLFGAFPEFGQNARAWVDSLETLGVDRPRALNQAPASWCYYAGPFKEAMATIPDQLEEADEPAVHAVAGDAPAPSPVAASPAPAPAVAQTAPVQAAPAATGGDRRAAIGPLLQQDITGLIEEILHIGADELDLDEDLTELGMDSIMAGELAAKLGYVLGIKIVPTLFFSSNTVNKIVATLVDEFADALAGYYADKLPHNAAAPSAPTPSAASVAALPPISEPVNLAAPAAPAPAPGGREPIAVLGVAGSFPNAEDPAALWANLLAGRECLSDLPESRRPGFGKDAVFPPGSTPRAGLMPNPEGFDARHFGIAPREAATLDPRQRLMLKWAWQALESAAIRPSHWAGTRTAVFIGVENNEYTEFLDPEDPYYGTSTGLTIIANRLSYTFDFNGTSEVVDSACAAGLLAVHRAVRALQNGEAETALAGGVSLMLAPQSTRQGLEAGMLSPCGNTRSFDKDAAGWVIGEGGGLVVLKPLAAAKRDGDPILAVIRGSAANHGGKVSSLTAPNPERMAEVAQAAMAHAGVGADTVTLVEAHGVGSALIDAAEVQGLSRAYRVAGSSGHCVLGSLTPNIGNLDPASGFAGLTKLIFALQQQTLPPQINCDEPHEHLNLEAGPFRFNREAQPWQPHTPQGTALPRRAGLHSFSWGGGNVHLILEEAPATTPVTTAGPFLALLSARTDAALQTRVRQLADYLAAHPDTDPARLCASLQLGREPMRTRLALQVASSQELASKLVHWLNGDKPAKSWQGAVPEGRPKAALIGDTPACRAYTAELFKGGFLAKIAAMWVEGAAIDWALCYPQGRPTPLLLPTYRFDEKPLPLRPSIAPRPNLRVADRDSLRALLEAVASGQSPVDAVLEQLAPAPTVQVEAPAPTPTTETTEDPQTQLRDCLRAMIAAVIHVEPEELNDAVDLSEFGIDSLTGMAFMKSLHERFGNRIPMTLLLSETTIDGIAGALWRDHRDAVTAGLAGKLADQPWSPLVTIQGSGDKPPSFWVHGAIGDVSWLIGIAHELGPDYPIYGLEPKGLDGSEPHADVTAMAACYLEAIQTVQPHGPYYLGGYSGGGIVVIEMTRLLQEQGEEVARLFIGDTFLQGSRYYNDATVRILEDLDLEAVQLCSLANIFAGLQGVSAVVTYPDLVALEGEARFEAVARHLHDNTNSPRDLAETHAWLRHNIAVGAQLAHVLTGYEPKPLTFVNRTSFFLCNKGFISPESKSRIPITTPTLDHVDHWQQLVPGEIEVVDVPCDHFELMHQPHVNLLIQNIRNHVR